jgi:integrase
MKRPGSANVQFIQRIPVDVIDKVRGMELAIPVAGRVVRKRISQSTPDIRLSLGTSDRAVGKERHAVVASYLQGVWQAVRNGPRRLTHKEVVALAGEEYRTWAGAFEDDPGSPETWARVTSDNVRAEAGLFGRAGLMIAPDDVVRAKSREERFGSFADAALARHGLVVDADSRTRLIAQISTVMREVGELNFARALGDYTPDPAPDRFPSFAGTKETPPTRPTGVRLQDLLAKMSSERGHAPKTRSEWARAVGSLTDHAKTTEETAFTTAMIVAWLDSLVAKGLAAKTINDGYLAAVKAVFAWADVRIGSNPAERVPRIRRSSEKSGQRGFTLQEAEQVLAAAARETNPVRRWLPWLMAYTGARAGEVAQLRRQDIKQEPETGIWYLDLSPTAGRLKNKPSERVVPLHPHLVELGFPEWAQSQPNERLFYTDRSERKGGGERRSRKSVAINRLGDWVRDHVAVEAVKAGEVAPNHGWRHRFTTEMVNLDVPDAVRKRLTGHRLDGQDNRYVGRLVMERLHEAVARLPRKRPGVQVIASRLGHRTDTGGCCLHQSARTRRPYGSLGTRSCRGQPHSYR